MSRDFLVDGGEMGRLISLKDWSNHELGPIEQWPQSLKSALGICLHSPFPMSVYWTKHMFLLYNDAWSATLGDKHPQSLGQPASEVWSDIWNIVGPIMQTVLRTGNGQLIANALLPMHRKGYLEECYFDHTYNPVFGEDQSIVGILNVGNEVTTRIINERRSRTLRNISEKSITTESPEAACILVANNLSEAPYDVPFALIYLLNEDADSIRLVGSTSLDDDVSIARAKIDITATDHLLPYQKTITSKQPQTVRSINKSYELPGGAWDEQSKDVVLLPLIRPRTNEMYGLMVIGVSPRLHYDQPYKDFYKLIAEHTAAAIGRSKDIQNKIILENREHDAREQLQSALTGGLIGVWSLNLVTNRIVLDKNLADRYGLDPDEARIGIDYNLFSKRLHPDDREMVFKKIADAVSKKGNYEVEYRVVLKDKSTHWVISRGRVQTDKYDNPSRLPGVVIDITDRKEIEQELASSERMFMALFESSIIGVAVATLDGKVNEANETFFKMFGYSKKDLKAGLTSKMLTPVKSNDVTSAIYRTLRSKGEVEPTEKEYLHKDGSIVPTLVGAVMIPGSADRFITFLLDISEQKKLLSLNKAKDEFITIASHQLRTPATGVKQYLGMLLEGYAGDINENQKNILKTAYESNERQLVIVNDLLRVAQADAKEVKLNREPVDIVLLINDVINEQASKFASKNQPILYTDGSKPAIGLLDPFYIRMVFENIIDNAHKYTQINKTIAISISQDKHNLIISIKDQGVGVKKRDMSKLFQKFSRIDNPLSSTSGGTGLGLYWVQKIIDLHQGVIEVYSTYKKGTEFIIRLPIGDKP